MPRDAAAVRRIKPWARAQRADLPLAIPDVAPDDWVRLVPVGGMEMAKYPAPAFLRDENGEPQPSPDVFIDRKLAPDFDLTPDTSPAELIASERFVRALEATQATGWSATLLPHVTPNAVAGRRMFRFACAGWTGPVSGDTALVMNKLDPNTEHSRGSDRALNGTPVAPVAFESRETGGDTVRWSPWLSGPKQFWRALVVRGDVYAELRRAIPDLRISAERVELRGARAIASTKGTVVAPSEAPPTPVVLDRLLATVESEAASRGHTLTAAAASSDVADAFRALGVLGVDALARCLERWNGLTLYRGALRLYATRGADDLVTQNASAASGGYGLPAGWFAFGEGPNGAYLWITNAEGRVRAAGRDGILYGPDAPFERWLGDQIADLGFAQDHDGAFAWTERMLRG